MTALGNWLKKPINAYVALLCLGVACWFSVIHDGIVSHDSAWLLRDNPILSTGDFAWIPDIWTDLSWSTRRVLGAEFLPVRDTDILIDFKLFGHNWTAFHTGNLVWYLMGCCLFLGICRHILGIGAASWIAAALFCVHPLHTENVAWLAGRKDLLGLVFFLSAWWSWLRHAQRGRTTALAFLLFVLGVWSKNTTIVLPAVLVFSDMLLHQKPLRDRRWHWLAWAAVSLPLIALSTRLGRQMRLFGEPVYESFPEGAALQIQLWREDLGRLFWPQDLALAYPLPSTTNSLHLMFSSLLLCGLLTAAWRARSHVGPLALGVALFFICSLPTTVFNQLQNTTADRYLLLPSLGIALILGTLLKLEAHRGGKLLHIALLISLVPLGMKSHLQAKKWRSDIAIWSASAHAQPRVLNNLAGKARALRNAGRAEEALESLGAQESTFGDKALFYQSRGATHQLLGNLEAAESDFRKALSLDTQLRISGNDLALILAQSGRLQEAIHVARRVTQAHPRYAQGFNTLGALLLDARELDEAEDALLQAESLFYKNANTACNLGSVYWLQLKKSPQARPAAEWWFSACKRRDPKAPVPPDLHLTP